jgi:hypothetical protein
MEKPVVYLLAQLNSLLCCPSALSLSFPAQRGISLCLQLEESKLSAIDFSTYRSEQDSSLRSE